MLAQSGARETQSTTEIQEALDGFLAEFPRAVVVEDGRVIFDMRTAKFRLATEHGRCTLHLWSEERNLVRRIVGVTARKDSLRISTMRFGQTKPQTLDLMTDRDRRTTSTREATRVKYLRVLERVLAREFPELRPEGLRTAMDLEKSFGPAYARGMLVQGQTAWAVIAVNEDETQTTVDGILTLGILWLHHCRESGNGRRLFQGLKIVVPRGMSALTLSRMTWLNSAAAKWELWELDQRTEEMVERDAADHGNVATRLMHAPSRAHAHERFAAARERVMRIVPEAMRQNVEESVRGGGEIAFLLHGLEFARAREGYAGSTFQYQQEITFGTGANETPLTDENEDELRRLVAQLFERRTASGDRRDPLYRMQPERWLESMLRRDVTPIDESLEASHVYTQVPAFSAGDRGMLDILSATRDGRLAVIELKADEDLHLALQGLDYWIRVRWHHRQNPDPVFGLGEFQRHGYFSQLPLSEYDPRLYLVAPALRIHPATETVLRYLSPRVEWTLVAVDERWRVKIKTVWRKRGGGPRSGDGG